MTLARPSIGLLLALLAMSPASAFTPAKSRGQVQVELTQWQKTAVQDAVRQKMRDPDSAKFDDWLVGFAPKKKTDTTVDVCGKVNGRNGYGGYTGMQYFYVGLMSLGPSHSHPGPLWFGIASIQRVGEEERFFRGFPICDFLKWK